jgi:hypothetical protein
MWSRTILIRFRLQEGKNYAAPALSPIIFWLLHFVSGSKLFGENKDRNDNSSISEWALI